MSSNSTENVFQLLVSLYGEAQAGILESRIHHLLERWRSAFVHHEIEGLSHTDVFLITYGDQVKESHRPHLHSLNDFCANYLAGTITAVHILPFYPYSSDDGFSVVDYRKVEPTLGDWSSVLRIGFNFRLMFDAVLNHVSVEHQWFQLFLLGDPHYQDFFIVINDDPDLSGVVRPRTLPLLTGFETKNGSKRVWTTFSEDQVDLNFKNPEVFMEILDLLLFYAGSGASFLRLDAVGYLWKEIGTSCIHLPETHNLIQLFRAILDQAAPHVFLITETNVPHAENISYFGNGKNEAQLVYNFALPPLVLHTIQTGNARAITRWAAACLPPSNVTTFFNFLASHDGIGINPVRGILSDAEIERLVSKCFQHGGIVSYKRNADGTESPYELNINYFDALSDPLSEEPLDLQVDRFAAAHAILLCLLGVPAIYFHSFFGSRGWLDGPIVTGRSRSINREKLRRETLEAELADSDSLRSKVRLRLKKLVQVRAKHRAFDPYGLQEILDFGESVFAVLRADPETDQHILCLQNVSAENQILTIPGAVKASDLLSPESMIDPGRLPLSAYQTRWIRLDA